MLWARLSLGLKFLGLNFSASARKENGIGRVLQFAFFSPFCHKCKALLSLFEWWVERGGAGGLQIAREERRGQGLVRRDSRLAGCNDLGPAAVVIKSWLLSVVLKSTAISLNAK